MKQRDRRRRGGREREASIASSINDSLLDLSNKAEWTKFAIAKLQAGPTAGESQAASRLDVGDATPERDDGPSL